MDERMYELHVHDTYDKKSVLGFTMFAPALPEITVSAIR